MHTMCEHAGFDPFLEGGGIDRRIDRRLQRDRQSKSEKRERVILHCRGRRLAHPEDTSMLTYTFIADCLALSWLL